MPSPPTSRDNPLGLDGFEFVEFTSPEPQKMVGLLEQLGFVATHEHPSKPATRYRQGRINLIVNRDEAGQAAAFRKAHGPSANGMAFRVADAAAAFEAAKAAGAKVAPKGEGLLGEGDAHVGRHRRVAALPRGPPRRSAATSTPTGPRSKGSAQKLAANDVGLEVLDHLTHNVKRGQMRTWSSFYNQVFGFEEQKYFDIKGKQTALFSQAMIALRTAPYASR